MKHILIAVMSMAALSAGAAMAGDVASGEKLTAKRCKSCHMIADGDNVILKGGRTGPNLFGVIGRQAGTYEGFKYGDDIVAAGAKGLVWSEATLADYVADPKKFLQAYLDDKGAKSRMTLKLKKGDQRADVAAYLASLGN